MVVYKVNVFKFFIKFAYQQSKSMETAETFHRYLTKSRFKLGMECPAKLFYTGKKTVYYDNRVEDVFLAALAEGGFQVGELAKLYYPDGIDVDDLDYEQALAKTAAALKDDTVTIYEAAFLYDNLFIRADIVKKQGNKIQLIEVKAKSYDAYKQPFIGQRGGIDSKWRPYLYDIAFQKYVVQHAYPEFEVSAYLMLSDKNKPATVEGLNQLFRIYEQDGRYRVIKPSGICTEELGTPILTAINIDDIIDRIYTQESPAFEPLVLQLASSYKEDVKIVTAIGGHCVKCEFNPEDLTIQKGYQSGFIECWIQAGVSPESLKKPLTTSLWNSRKKDELIKSGKHWLGQITPEDLAPASKKKEEPVSWLTPLDRQVLQIDKAVQQDANHFLNIEGLRNEISSWKFPLHFIDFETTAVAIPFNAGRKPFEQIAFQFSHHIFYANGSVEHKDEWINTEVGKFPNFEFLRALKAALENDDGTIFRYAAHENSILNAIYRQLKDSTEADRNELCAWIKTITKATGSSTEKWEGPRNMVDLHQLVLRYYYNPQMKGSNSIKQVLPAILNSSEYLKQKYSQPIYGSAIRSLNFQNQVWIVYDQKGIVVNPYKLLPSIHANIDNELLDEMFLDEEAGIMDGGAAMMAYAKMQFSEMTNQERQRVQGALLRYCELDTLAMVMIYEAWNEWCK
jgi:hypothetical protein